LAALAAKDAVGFYVLVLRGSIRTALPVPLSLVVATLLAAGLVAMFKKEVAARERPHRFLTDSVAAAVGFGVLVLSHLITFGTTDYTRSADAAVVLGAKVYPDGTASLALSDRVRTAIDLFRQGRVRFLIMSGATGVEGHNEAEVMRRLAVEAGVPAWCVLVDDAGVNTSESARRCARILTERRLDTVLVVSHYYHLARSKMAFVDQGVACFTVPARMSRRLAKEPYFVLRECAAYLAYCAAKPFRRRESGELDAAERDYQAMSGTHVQAE
jgi:vancomycin permeability regulator SanA